jgi:uncharacterized protein (DUF2062 family)
MGWTRTLAYYRHRIFRTGDSTYKITAGLAAGASISFSPFLGTHFLQCFVAAYMLRANWIAAFVGTALGNPWTFPFLFALAYRVGVYLCDLAGFADFIALPDDATFDHFMEQPFDFLVFLYSHPLKFLLPMTVGGYLCALLSWPLFYGALYYPVRAARTTYRLQRIRRRRLRMERKSS